MLRKTISILLIPLFIATNLAFADTLARFSFMQLAKAEGDEFSALAAQLVKTYVKAIDERVEKSEGKITLSDALVEMNAEIEKWAKEATLGTEKKQVLLEVLLLEAAKLQRETLETKEKTISAEVLGYVRTNLRDLRGELPAGVVVEEVMETLALFRQKPSTEVTTVRTKINLLRLGVPLKQVNEIFTTLTSGTIPAPRKDMKALFDVIAGRLKSKGWRTTEKTTSSGKETISYEVSTIVGGLKKPINLSIRVDWVNNALTFLEAGPKPRFPGDETGLAQIDSLTFSPDDTHAETVYVDSSQKPTDFSYAAKCPLIDVKVVPQSDEPIQLVLEHNFYEFGRINFPESFLLEMPIQFVSEGWPEKMEQTPEAVIANVEELTKQASTRAFLRPEGPIDLSKTAVVIKKGLAKTFLPKEKGTLGDTLKQEYQVMKQNLADHFHKVVEVEKEKDLPGVVNKLIATDHLKVIVLDDGTLTAVLRDSPFRGIPADDYCVISAKKSDLADGTNIQFLNLNAMSLLGVAVLNNDERLYKLAFQLVTGEEADTARLANLAERTLWRLVLLPRIVKFTGNLQDIQQLKKLFEISA